MQNAPPKNLNETLILGQELLNAVYKPLGTISGTNLGDLETTPISTLKVGWISSLLRAACCISCVRISCVRSIASFEVVEC